MARDLGQYAASGASRSSPALNDPSSSSASPFHPNATSPDRTPTKTRLLSVSPPPAQRTSSWFWRRRSTIVVAPEEGVTSPDSVGAVEDLPVFERPTRKTTATAGLVVEDYMHGAGPASSLRGRPASAYLLDKELPNLPERPLPPIITSEPEQDPHIRSPDSEFSISSSPSGPSRVTVTPSSPAAYSHHTVPKSMPASTLTFAEPGPSNERINAASQAAKPSVRRARSFLSSDRDIKAQSDTEDFGARRRRRLSVGTGVSSLFNGSGVDSKGKGKEKVADEVHADDDKSLTRRPSFWTRRLRKESTPSAPSASSVPSTPIPDVPSAPFDVPMARISQSSLQSRQQAETFVSPPSSSPPSLPSFRPTSPLMGDFSLSDSPGDFGVRGPNEEPTYFSLASTSSMLAGSSNSSRSGLFTRSSTERTLPATASRESVEAQAQATKPPSLASATKSHKSEDSLSKLRIGTQPPTSNGHSAAEPRQPASPTAVSPTTSRFFIPPKRRPTRPSTAENNALDKTWNGFEHGIIHEGHAATFTAKTAVTQADSGSRLTGRLRTLSLRDLRRGSKQDDDQPPLPAPIPSGDFASYRLGSPEAERLPPRDENAANMTPGVTVTRSPSGASTGSLSSHQSHAQLQTRTGRQRASTSVSGLNGHPPLFRRLSQHFFASPPTLPTSTANSSTSSVMLALPGASGTLSPPQRPGYSRGSSSLDDGSTTASVPSFLTSSTVPRRMEEETPERYLERLVSAVSKAEIATVLASSGDAFHLSALRIYISQFNFTNDPLDVALRKLLMDVSLPKETQQIDRVMEAFAQRYDECNPGLFVSNDHPYILAFSLMMLHTDAFNPSNKRKMTKADYTRNTRLPGLPLDVLDCFYDNIVFAPFIFIEDPMDVNGQRGFIAEGTPVLPGMTSSFGTPGGASPAVGVGGSSMFGQIKIDPYYLISRNLLVSMRRDVENEIPQINPFLYTGTAETWDERKLQSAFADAEQMEIVNPTRGRRRGSAPLTALGSEMNPIKDEGDNGNIVLKVTKFGVLSRKEDLLGGGKRSSSRKWKEWSVLLTGSQLLFFKDPLLASAFSDGTTDLKYAVQPETGRSSSGRRIASLQPDEILSVRDAIALYDTTYRKYPSTFRLLMPGGRQYLLHAPEEMAMNEWMSLINYASAFKTAGVHMRPSGMTDLQARHAGTAAAISHVKEMGRRRLTSVSGQPPKIAPQFPKTPSTSDLHGTDNGISDLGRTVYSSSATLNTSSASISASLPGKRKPATSSVDASPPLEPSDGRLEDTFFEVKAELAGLDPATLEQTDAVRASRLSDKMVARSISLGKLPPDDEERRRISSEEPIPQRGTNRGSRSIVISAKLKDLESKISAAQTGLDTELRVARNLAVLAPFQRSTRERLLQIIPPLGRRIRSMRMNIAKLVCHRDVLYADIVAEDKEWHETLEVALSAGTDFLKRQNQSNDLGSRNDVPPIPRMTLSDYSVPGGPTIARHSADESGRRSRDDSSQPATSPSGPQSTYSSLPQTPNPSADTPIPSETPGGKASVEFPERPVNDTENREPPSPSEVHEEAEEWSKTRAAKRVSLALLPSERKLSALSLLNRHVSSPPTVEATVEESGETAQRNDLA